MVEASVNGTLRTILVLMILWLVLRMFLRSQQASRAANAQGPQRKKGEVHIEDPRQKQASPIRPNDTIIDADYEEIK